MSYLSSPAQTPLVPLLRQRVVQFYEFYNPRKLTSVEAVLHEFENDPNELFEVLEAQYGPAPWKLENPWRTRLIACLEHHPTVRPERVDELLTQYKGREADLLVALEASADACQKETAGRSALYAQVHALLMVIDPARADDVDGLLRQWTGREHDLLAELRKEKEHGRADGEQRRREATSLDTARSELNRLRRENDHMDKEVVAVALQVLNLRVEQAVQRANVLCRTADPSSMINITVTSPAETEEQQRPACMTTKVHEALWAVLNAEAVKSTFTSGISEQLEAVWGETTLRRERRCTVVSSHGAGRGLLLPDRLIALIMRQWCELHQHTLVEVRRCGVDGTTVQSVPGRAWWRLWPVPVAPNEDDLHMRDDDSDALVDSESSEYWRYFLDEWTTLSHEMSTIKANGEASKAMALAAV
eukprot:PhM_4_TR9442/c0_g1_i2/m.59886